MLGIDSARNCINGARPERPSRAVSWRRTAMRDVERTEVRGGWMSAEARRLPETPHGQFQRPGSRRDRRESRETPDTGTTVGEGRRSALPLNEGSVGTDVSGP